MAEPPKDIAKDLERSIGELEERVDRLRASYEQYFMGYEKIEPGVQRKDVDRRFTILRKTQIRNTALRYRFNVVTQKFNTYAMYWTRVCRQIEEGTFKRHIQKAERKFGGPRGQKRDNDFSIDVELGDFDEVDMSDDMDAMLAEANAAAEAYAGGASDTVPPPARSDPPEVASFAVTGPHLSMRNISAADSEEATPSPMNGGVQRAARHVALPAGTKPRVVVRRRGSLPDDIGPSSAHNVMGSSPDLSPPSNSAIRAAPSGPQLPDDASRPALRRMPAAAPVGGTPAKHVHHAASAATGHRPAIRPAGSNPLHSPAAGSIGRIPVAPPPQSKPDMAAARPLPAPSGNRLPVPPPGPRPSGPRLPLPLPAASTPRIAPAAPSGRDSSHGRDSSPGSGGPDSEPPRPSRKPPPALPSKHKKDED